MQWNSMSTTAVVAVSPQAFPTLGVGWGIGWGREDNGNEEAREGTQGRGKGGRGKDRHRRKRQTCMAFSQVVALISIPTQPLLVSPVGRQAMLSNEVHFGSPDLDFHRDAIIPNHDCVQGPVTVGFGILNVVLEATIHWLPQFVHLQIQMFVVIMIW